jgi:hypothetical protein
MINKINLPFDDYCWHIEEIMDRDIDNFNEYLGYLDKAFKTISEDERENEVYFSFIEYCSELKEVIEELIKEDNEKFGSLEKVIEWLDKLINEEIEISYLPVGYFLIVTDKKDKKKYYSNDEIGKYLGIDYGKLVLKNNGFMYVSAEDLGGNDIEEYWFEELEDCERVKGVLEGMLKDKENKNIYIENKSNKEINKEKKNYRLLNENKMKDYLS